MYSIGPPGGPVQKGARIVLDEYRLEIEHVSKSFPGVKALDNVSLKVRPGSVHALAGENGAGKSTLMKIINGIYKADPGGEIRIDGKSVQIRDPIEARRLGISMIFQELNYVPELTVEENLFLCREPMKGVGKAFLDKRAAHRQACELIEREGFHYNPKTKMKDLSVSDIQMIEILKAVSCDASLIIMDEPTSAITDKEVEILFAKIKQLQARGISFVYISHRMEEIFRIADEVTVMRDGQVVHNAKIEELDNDLLISYMVGRKLDNIYPKEQLPLQGGGLELRGCSGEKFHDISMTVQRGEIVGLAGLMGAGRTELARAVFGMDPLEEGKVFVDGQELQISHPSDAKKQGLVMVSEDRRQYGFIGCRSVKENIALSSLDARLSGFGLLSFKKEADAVHEMVDLFHVKAPSTHANVENLSGGNQQKVVLSKWFLTNPKVLILDEPTRGIDVGAKFEIYAHMTELAKQGMAILMISSELPELIGMCDRIYVMCRGELAGEVSGADMNQTTIMKLAIEGAEHNG